MTAGHALVQNIRRGHYEFVVSTQSVDLKRAAATHKSRAAYVCNRPLETPPVPGWQCRVPPSGARAVPDPNVKVQLELPIGPSLQRGQHLRRGAALSSSRSRLAEASPPLTASEAVLIRRPAQACGPAARTRRIAM